MVAGTQALVAAFDAGQDTQAAKSKSLIEMLLAGTPAPFSREQFTPGHITCTAVVLSPDGRRVVLIFHRKLQRWLLPGGHVEPGDASAFAAARREAVEETSVRIDEVRTPVLVNVDVHGIPARKGEPYHLHHDLIVAFVAWGEELSTSEETPEVMWCRVEELAERGVDLSTQIAVERARAVMS